MFIWPQVRAARQENTEQFGFHTPQLDIYLANANHQLQSNKSAVIIWNQNKRLIVVY